jgi:hypothetical protein
MGEYRSLRSILKAAYIAVAPVGVAFLLEAAAGGAQSACGSAGNGSRVSMQDAGPS